MKMGQDKHLRNLLVVAACACSVAQPTAISELLLRNEVLYESLRNTFSFDVVEEAVNEETILPMEMISENGDSFICSFVTDEENNKEYETETNDNKNLNNNDNKLDKKKEYENVLSDLDGHCETLNTGWWSYQWCHRREVKQFHVDVTQGTIDPEWSLGSYEKSMIKFNDDHQTNQQKKKNKQDQDKYELLFQEDITDYFINGQNCDETGKGRKTKVDFKCCNDEETQSKLRKRNKKKASSTSSSSSESLASFYSITENEVCSYEVIICTPLMCENNHDNNNNDGSNDNKKLNKNDSALTLLNPLKKQCLLRHEGWWSYELCYQKQIRQFHVVTGTDSKGKATSHVEGEFVLGKATLELAKDIPVKDEPKYIVSPPIDDPNAPFSIEMKYVDGTPCDLVNTPRTTTIQYVCGNIEAISSIVEERTCHYRMVVTSSHLCKHPSFVQRNPSTRSIKCEKTPSSD